MNKMKSSLLFLSGILIGLTIFYQMGYYVLSSFLAGIKHIISFMYASLFSNSMDSLL